MNWDPCFNPLELQVGPGVGQRSQGHPATGLPPCRALPPACLPSPSNASDESVPCAAAPPALKWATGFVDPCDSACLEMDKKVFLKLWVKMEGSPRYTQIVPKWHLAGKLAGTYSNRISPPPFCERCTGLLPWMGTTFPGSKGQPFKMWHKRLLSVFWLFSLLNRVNSAYRRSLEINMMEKLLVVARDAAPFYEYNDQPVVGEGRKTRTGTDLRSECADQGDRVWMGSRAWIWTSKQWCPL